MLMSFVQLHLVLLSSKQVWQVCWTSILDIRNQSHCSRIRMPDISTFHHCSLVEVQQLPNQQLMKRTSHLLQQKSDQEEFHHLCWSSCLVPVHQTKSQMRVLLSFAQLHLVWWLQVQQNQ